jgi:hypothetical protein
MSRRDPLPDHVATKRATWTRWAAEYVEPGRRNWADSPPADPRLRGRDLVEIRAPEGATTRYTFVTPKWARRWPSEEVWIARKRD